MRQVSQHGIKMMHDGPFLSAYVPSGSAAASRPVRYHKETRLGVVMVGAVGRWARVLQTLLTSCVLSMLCRLRLP